jgi:hypothetical protein
MSDNFYLFKRFVQVGNIQRVIEPGERTPYPIIIERPTFRDVFYNMGLAEWMPLVVLTPVGAYAGFHVTHQLFDLPLSRRRAFGGIVFLFAISGFYLGLKGSFYKLTGFENNGLRWKRPEQRVKKYVFTEEMHGFWEEMLKGEELDRN